MQAHHFAHKSLYHQACRVGVANEDEYAYLDSLLITTSVAFVLLDLGSPIMKSVAMSSQITIGVGKSCKRIAREDT